MVAFYGKLVRKSTVRPMDPMGKESPQMGPKFHDPLVSV